MVSYFSMLDFNEVLLILASGDSKMYPNRFYIYKYTSTTISQKLERRNMNIRQNQLREFGKPRSMLSGTSCLHFNHPNHSSLGSRQFFTVWLCFDYPAPVYTRRRLALTIYLHCFSLDSNVKNHIFQSGSTQGRGILFLRLRLRLAMNQQSLSLNDIFNTIIYILKSKD